MSKTWNQTLLRKAVLLAGALGLTVLASGLAVPKAEASLCCSVCRDNYQTCSDQCPYWQTACAFDCEDGYTFCLATCNMAC